jgi:hypothetical protein
LTEEVFQIIGTRRGAVRKCFAERAVITETGRDVPPLGEQRLIGSASRDIAADGHSAKRAAVIALAAGNDAITRGLSAFEMKLTHQFDRGFRGFRAAGSEIDAPITKTRRSQIE